MCTLEFLAFLGWNELWNLRVEDLTFHKPYMSVRIKKRINDQIRKGSKIDVAKSNSDTCPVRLGGRFLRVSKQ